MCTDSATDGNRRRYRVGHRRHILGDLEACVITVVNHSQRVSNSDVALMTGACASQLWWHAAPAWGRTPTPVVYAVDEKSAPPGSQVIGIFDTPDQPGVLGWHTEDANGVIYGRVFAGVVLDHGGTVMAGQLSVSAVLSHEVLEDFIDPNCNLWIDVDGRRSYALEVGDPVEADSYALSIDNRSVAVSNFITSKWADPAARSGFDHMGRCSAPFQMAPGGYVLQMIGGQVSQVFAAEYPEWKKSMKESPLARTSRRLAVA